MNQYSHSFAKREGLPAKHLRPKDRKPKQINDADVAELVDARDLKSPAPIDPAQFSFKTRIARPVEMAPDPRHLQNISEAA